ncbi:hypothetical protein HanIR_Chr03g0148511 [Helianthus annuus]|nr:hypothetical protein HanIR_Chr03g0148511 [Helianthus annuus]
MFMHPPLTILLQSSPACVPVTTTRNTTRPPPVDYLYAPATSGGLPSRSALLQQTTGSFCPPLASNHPPSATSCSSKYPLIRYSGGSPFRGLPSYISVTTTGVANYQGNNTHPPNNCC